MSSATAPGLEGVRPDPPGTVLAAQVWGDQYGALTDRFGVDWMADVSAPA
ncbi:hypothetical protein [Kineococcus esterisolvens]